MAQLQDGGLNATVTLSLSDSALSAASLATAGVGEICQLYISGTDSTQKISVVFATLLHSFDHGSEIADDSKTDRKSMIYLNDIS